MPGNAIIKNSKNSMILIVFVIDRFNLEILNHCIEKSSGNWEYENIPSEEGTIVIAKINYFSYWKLVQNLQLRNLILKPRRQSNLVYELSNL